MEKVIYRELSRNDYSRIKELICEAFGFSDFIKNEKLLDAILSTYLHGCIMDSSFSRVAVKNNNVIGIILGSAKNDKNNLKKLHNNLSFLSACTKLLASSKEDKMLIKEFSIIKDTYKEIISGKEDSFQGCVQLFIVSQESRGLGIGKTLVSDLFDYMKSMSVSSLYLYTDTRCNYGFYDNNNFNRINEKEIYFNSIDANLDVFLYSYTFQK
ncbi:GNAT family N-acetyltransferase [Romboutsia weinsteinii]|uniref:GNAT family N-acetyltransferase n=1 Tax=Romboutsia weinsteinii TaxID=2020949 RepID=A0A371J9S5_9FIRM|nr:GNAT family N-acetyltransferase [Romboutsia weinsteinii]RDY29509.1 GNAT family N-acetyltransferase [Romboutsia weinsteinii]